MTHTEKLSIMTDKNLCRNCLSGGHLARQCKSLHKCRKCQRPHHTLLHFKRENETGSDVQVATNAAVKLRSSSLLMTCRVLVTAPNGSSMEARALLDNASSASFVSQRLAQSLSLPLSRQKVHVSGIAGVSPMVRLNLLRVWRYHPPQVEKRLLSLPLLCPRSPVICHSLRSRSTRGGNNLSGLTLADPDFGNPGRIDLLLGVEVFVDALLNGRRTGPPGSPVALETEFGWVLSEGTETCDPVSLRVTSLHISTSSGNDLLRRFWEVEQGPLAPLALSPKEKYVVQHYNDNHTHTGSGRFIVPLHKKPDAAAIGESRSQAVRRFLSLECSLHSKKEFQAFDVVLQDYLDKEHAELVPEDDTTRVVLPPHACRSKGIEHHHKTEGRI